MILISVYATWENKRLYIYLLHMYAKMMYVSLYIIYTFAISQFRSAKEVQGHCLYKWKVAANV